jgi:hypothetical protein
MADPSLIAVGATSCGLSLIFGAVSWKAHREHRAWCARGIRAEGVVSRLAERRRTGLSEDASGMPADPAAALVPVVRFRAANGIEYEIDAPDAPAQIGAAVQVAYEAAEPSGARAVERPLKIGCVVFLLVAGLLLVAIGISR